MQGLSDKVSDGCANAAPHNCSTDLIAFTSPICEAHDCSNSSTNCDTHSKSNRLSHHYTHGHPNLVTNGRPHGHPYLWAHPAELSAG